MTSKKGSKELISLLEYMKETDIENPNILVRDKRILELNEIVNEVKESEEWEAVQMNILEIGIEHGIEQGLQQGIEALILDNLEEGIPKSRIIEKLMKRFSLDEKRARDYLDKYAAPVTTK